MFYNKNKLLLYSIHFILKRYVIAQNIISPKNIYYSMKKVILFLGFAYANQIQIGRERK